MAVRPSVTLSSFPYSLWPFLSRSFLMGTLLTRLCVCMYARSLSVLQRLSSVAAWLSSCLYAGTLALLLPSPHYVARSTYKPTLIKSFGLLVLELIFVRIQLDIIPV